MSMRISGFLASDKEGQVREWARKKLGTLDHELRVADAARMLFNLTRRWHGLGTGECNLLVMGALVHDVGRAISDEDHARIGAEMILENEKLSASERRRLGYMTRYHRGKVPAAGSEEILDESDDRAAMRVLLGILRAADSLDSRSCGTPRLVMAVRGRVLTIYGHIEDEVAARRLGRRKKLKLMEETLGCEVRTEWFVSEEAGVVG